MDRFRLDGVDGDGFDTVEPMRPSSFDMSFSLGSYTRTGLERDSDGATDQHKRDHACDDLQHCNNDCHSRNSASGGAANRVADPERANADAATSSKTISNRAGEKGRLHADEMSTSASPPGNARWPETRGRNNTIGSTTSTSHKDVASIAQRLEEKAHETIAAASLCGKIPWRLAKRTQDVHIYRPASLPAEEDASSKLYFRVSCEVKAHLGTIMEYLTPSDSKSYFDIESQVFPGLLHAAVVKRMELPETTAASASTTTGGASGAASASHEDTASSVDEDGGEPFPHLQVKWHASRFAGRFVKPVDFFFVEYANIEAMADGRKRGYGYIRSVESFKGDELTTRLHSGNVVIPPSVAKCKRAVINKGIYLVSPSGDATGTYEVTFMMVIDFQKQFTSGVGSKIIHNFTERLMGIREQLFNTLFQPVTVLPRAHWKPPRGNKCALCISSFSLVKMTHHCRACGEAVCGQCSRKWALQPGAQPETQARLCTSCSLQARSYLMGGGDAASRSPAATTASSSRLSSSSSSDFTSSQGETTLTRSSHVPRMGSINTNTSACDVQVASTVSNDSDTFAAATAAFAQLVVALGGQTPHFMLVSYSQQHHGAAVYESLARSAPDTLFMGGTSSAGVFVGVAPDKSTSSSSSKTRHGHGHGPTVGLWGIYDPEGSYAVLSADLERESARDAARRCLLDGMGMLCMEPEESPDFVWTVLGGGGGDEQLQDEEEQLTRAVNEVVDCSYSVVGGTSTRTGDGLTQVTQLCSEGGAVGCVTQHGVCFAICCPSVEVAHAFFTCYDTTDKSFVVTKANGRELVALDHKPALQTLNEATHGMLAEFTQRPERFRLDASVLPAYYPVARERRGALPRGFKHKSARFQVLQPETATRGLTLKLGAEVRLGERLRMMTLSPQSVGSKTRRGLRGALKVSLPMLDALDVLGCWASVGSAYDRVLQSELQAVANATTRAFPGAATLVDVSHGQQGVLTGGSEAVHANGMVTALLLTSRKKARKLRPLQARRNSTH